MKTPLDTSVEAEYADGFILSETEQDDASLYAHGKNTLYDIIERRPEAAHGRMVRLSCYWHDARYDVDWTALPDNARAIRFRDGYLTIDQEGNEVGGWCACRFGYQYNTPDGRNHQEVAEL